MKYLGKRYLKNWLIDNGYGVSNELEYEKYRGDEWLRSSDIDMYCVRGKAIYISLFDYSELLEKRVEYSRISYYLVNGQWVKRYERNGVKVSIFPIENI